MCANGISEENGISVPIPRETVQGAEQVNPVNIRASDNNRLITYRPVKRKIDFGGGPPCDITRKLRTELEDKKTEFFSRYVLIKNEPTRDQQGNVQAIVAVDQPNNEQNVAVDQPNNEQNVAAPDEN